LLHRAEGRGLDLDRRFLPGRDHPGERAPALPGERHRGSREEFLAHRRLWRGRGLCDGHLRGVGAGAERRRAGTDRGARADDGAAAGVLQGPGRGGCGGRGAAVTLRIAMWSGPRNLSTAMMRSFGNRADTAVSDEPFYGAFLKTSGLPHPMAAEVIAAMDCDWQSVARTLAGPAPDGKPVWYQKQTWHHTVGPGGYEDFGAANFT